MLYVVPTTSGKAQSILEMKLGNALVTYRTVNVKTEREPLSNQMEPILEAAIPSLTFLADTSQPCLKIFKECTSSVLQRVHVVVTKLYEIYRYAYV